MLRSLSAAVIAAILPLASTALAQEDKSCREVRLAETGWTDLALTTATAEQVLEALDYQPSRHILGLGVIHESLKNGDLDAFLGNWPTAQIEFEHYYQDGSVEVLGTNLEETKFTLAVPTYVADAGVHSFDDLPAHAERFNSTILGIEPGSNRYL